MYNKNFDNTSGFTLIEIIASIALLALVITLLLPIFPQILQWTNKTENELTASNLIGQVAHDASSGGFSTTLKCGEDMEKVMSKNYRINEKDYNGIVYICKENEVVLYRAHLKVYSDGDLVSESFTYIEGDN